MNNTVVNWKNHNASQKRIFIIFPLYMGSTSLILSQHLETQCSPMMIGSQAKVANSMTRYCAALLSHLLRRQTLPGANLPSTFEKESHRPKSIARSAIVSLHFCSGLGVRHHLCLMRLTADSYIGQDPSSFRLLWRLSIGHSGHLKLGLLPANRQIRGLRTPSRCFLRPCS